MIDFPLMESPTAAPGAVKTEGQSPRLAEVALQISFGRGVVAAKSPTHTRYIMNRHNRQPELIVSGIHLDLTPSLKTFVREKAERLFRHEDSIIRLRIELECDPKQSVSNRFCAKGHISINGPDLNATVCSDECHKAVAFLIDKLDRMLHRRSQTFKARRHSATAPVEVDAIPG